MGEENPSERIVDLRPTATEVDQNYGYRERFEPDEHPRERLEATGGDQRYSDDEIAGFIAPAAHDLVLSFEVDGRAGYDRRYCRPCRPPGPSGVTIGIGHDLGYDRPAGFLEKWAGEIAGEDVERLSHAVGLKSALAQDFLSRVRDIVVPWEAAMKVYQKKTVPDYGRQTIGAFPGSEALDPHCFGALFSLVYNRGPGLGGDRRYEMRNIRDAIIAGKPDQVPHEIRAMQRLWGRDESGLLKRRVAEAALFERGLEAARNGRLAAFPIASAAAAAALNGAQPVAERVGSRAAPPDGDGDGAYMGDADYEDKPEGARHNELERLPAWSEVRWVEDDTLSTEYRHILEADRTLLKEVRFQFAARDLELLIRANSFMVLKDHDRVIFGLRGALLDYDAASPDDRYAQPNRQSLRLKVCRPDHNELRCVIGVSNLTTGLLSGFMATTVPNRGVVWSYAQGGNFGNLVACGCYRFVVGAHSKGKYKGCLRQDEPFAVLRSRDNTVYDVKDTWDLKPGEWPWDNIHPAFSDRKFNSAKFSSFGCQTIRGRFGDGEYTDEFAKFRGVLGLGPPGSDDGRKFSYVLLTGQEAAIAASLRTQGKDTSHADVRESLARLRQGSCGETVSRLQKALGLIPDGIFSAQTKMQLVAFQRQRAGELSGDGVYAPALDRALGLDVFGEQTVAVTAPPILLAAAASPGVRERAQSSRDQGGARYEAVYYELGRRAQHAQQNPELLTATVMPQYEAITSESWSGTVALGQRVLANLEHRLNVLVCGDGAAEKPDRDKIQAAIGSAIGQGNEALVKCLTGIISGWLFVPAIVSRPVAEILVNQVFASLGDALPNAAGENVATLCRLWGRRLYDEARRAEPPAQPAPVLAAAAAVSPVQPGMAQPRHASPPVLFDAIPRRGGDGLTAMAPAGKAPSGNL